MFDFDMSMLCVDVMVMSSAYVLSVPGACDVRVPNVHMLNKVGDRTPPCGTSVLN